MTDYAQSLLNTPHYHTTFPKTLDQIHQWWKDARANIAKLPIDSLYQVLKNTAALAPFDQLSNAIELAESIAKIVNTVPRQKCVMDSTTLRLLTSPG